MMTEDQLIEANVKAMLGDKDLQICVLSGKLSAAISQLNATRARIAELEAQVVPKDQDA